MREHASNPALLVLTSDILYLRSLEIDFELMTTWARSDVEAYFESGGLMYPTMRTEGSEPSCTNPSVYSAPARHLLTRPRVALLHGTSSNSSILQFQLNHLVSRLRDVADVYFIEGHESVPESNPMVTTMRRHFGADQALKEYATAEWDERQWRVYPTIHKGLASIESQLAAIPGKNADALIGFSQVFCVLASSVPQSHAHCGVSLLVGCKYDFLLSCEGGALSATIWLRHHVEPSPAWLGPSASSMVFPAVADKRTDCLQSHG